MDYMTYVQKLETIKYLAEKKRTGSPKELAEKLDVSERTVQRMIQRLRENGIEICFSRNRSSYIILQHEKI